MHVNPVLFTLAPRNNFTGVALLLTLCQLNLPMDRDPIKKMHQNGSCRFIILYLSDCFLKSRKKLLYITPSVIDINQSNANRSNTEIISSYLKCLNSTFSTIRLYLLRRCWCQMLELVNKRQEMLVLILFQICVNYGSLRDIPLLYSFPHALRDR